MSVFKGYFCWIWEIILKKKKNENNIFKIFLICLLIEINFSRVLCFTSAILLPDDDF